jgi:hypothetical protein
MLRPAEPKRYPSRPGPAGGSAEPGHLSMPDRSGWRKGWADAGAIGDNPLPIQAKFDL